MMYSLFSVALTVLEAVSYLACDSVMGAWTQRIFIAVFLGWALFRFFLSMFLAKFGHLSRETHCAKKRHRWSNLICFFFFFFFSFFFQRTWAAFMLDLDSETILSTVENSLFSSLFFVSEFLKYKMERVEWKLHNVCLLTIVTSVISGPLQALPRYTTHWHQFQTCWSMESFVDFFEF